MRKIFIVLMFVCCSMFFIVAQDGGAKKYKHMAVVPLLEMKEISKEAKDKKVFNKYQDWSAAIMDPTYLDDDMKAKIDQYKSAVSSSQENTLWSQSIFFEIILAKYNAKGWEFISMDPSGLMIFRKEIK